MLSSYQSPDTKLGGEDTGEVYLARETLHDNLSCRFADMYVDDAVFSSLPLVEAGFFFFLSFFFGNIADER